METITKLYRLDTLDSIVELLYGLRKDCQVYTFTGDLGAGKTTLIKSLFKQWGIDEPVTSPTFNYVNMYRNQKGETLYHFDLYRLESLEEFMAMGFEEYLYQPFSFVFVEWPNIIKPLVDHNVCNVHIDFVSEHERKINIELFK